MTRDSVDAALASGATERLTNRQAEILSIIERVYEVTGESVSASYLARRLDVHHEAIRGHLAALYRKGRVVSESSPATPTRWLQR